MTNSPTLERYTAPATEPLVLSDVKDYLKVSGSADDTIITNLIKTARERAEKFIGCSLITQSWKMSYDQYTPSFARLYNGPVQSVTSVTVFNRDEVATVISSAAYYLTTAKKILVFDANIVSQRIEIIYVAGYGTLASSVPSPIKQGMLAHIAAIYDGRVGANRLPEQSFDLYAPYRDIKF
jgi:uncharacterized phiE125 gp8 family phage protein